MLVSTFCSGNDNVTFLWGGYNTTIRSYSLTVMSSDVHLIVPFYATEVRICMAVGARRGKSCGEVAAEILGNLCKV